MKHLSVSSIRIIPYTLSARIPVGSYSDLNLCSHFTQTYLTQSFMTDEPPRDNFSGFDLEKSAIHKLHQLNQRVSEIFESQIDEVVLTARQFSVLSVVSREEGLSQAALVQRTGIDRSTLADIVKRMIKKGYISRRRLKQDGRAYSVKITNTGLHALKWAEPVVKRIDEIILLALPHGQGARFLFDLNLVLEGLNPLKEKAEV